MTNDEINNELKRCPFCGGEVVHLINAYGYIIHPERLCILDMKVLGINDWNKRHENI